MIKFIISNQLKFLGTYYQCKNPEFESLTLCSPTFKLNVPRVELHLLKEGLSSHMRRTIRVLIND
jgi:hypothetical protein